MGTTIAWTISVATSNNFFGGGPKISSCEFDANAGGMCEDTAT